MENIIGLKEFRGDVQKIAEGVARGQEYVVVKHSQPLFRITPVDEAGWEEVVDFTKLRKGGVDINDILKRL